LGRQETPIYPGAGPLRDLAAGLRLLRVEAGSPSYRCLARRTHFSVSTLARAADGRRLPSLDVLLAYVRACGGDEQEWRSRWQFLLRDRALARAPEDARAPEPPGPSLVPRQLPTDVRDYVGREAELRRVSQRTSGGSPTATSVIAISGLPGVGKTAFAVHVAHGRAEAFPDGQLFSDLRGMDEHPVAAERVLARFMRSLGFAENAPGDLDELAAVYRSMLTGRRCLISLDKAADEEHVRPLIPAEPACLVLITSRNRLAGLPGAAFVALNPLGPSEALQLLTGIADSAAGQQPHSRELVQLCGRLPLALRIVGAQLATGAVVSAAQLAERLHAEESRLARLEVGDFAIRSSFALSYEALHPAARLVFRRLGVFPGPTVTPDIAAELAGISPDAAAETFTLLQQRNGTGAGAR
jgi:NB-ARC domain/Helix-turn-helix domain